MNATPENKEKSNVTVSQVSKALWFYTKNIRPGLAFIVISAVLASALTSITPLFYKRFFDVIGSGDITDAVLKAAVSSLVIVFVLKGVQWALNRSVFVLNRVQTRALAELAEDASARLARHSYSFFTNSFAGSLVRRVTRFGSSFEIFSDQLIFNLIPLVVSIVGIIIVASIRSATIGFILFVWVFVLIYFSYRAIAWKQKYEIKRAEGDSAFSGMLSDQVVNNTNIKVFSRFKHEKSLLGGVIENLRNIRRLTWDLNEIIRGVQLLLSIVAEVVVMLGAFHFYKQGLLTVGDFVLFQTYIITISSQIWGIGWVFRALFQAFADAQEMVEILEKPYDVQDVRDAKELVVSKGEIEFDNVEFAFNETRTVLKNFTLKVNPGEKIAFVGPSGAGKSTITKLLFRFFDVADGKIKIDGQDISKVTQDSLRENISLVPQDPILFHRSLMDNIRYGRLDATDEEVHEAAKKAHCHEFISELPEGYNTFVGERGVKLSGGERQRVAIARAILKNAPILVLDEATSSLDSESESLIQEALIELMKGKTTLVIAHRLSTIMSMDRIIVVEDGKVRSDGTHKQLLKKDSLYKKLWSIQAGGFIQE